MGELREEKLGDTDGAVEIYDRVLERDAGNVRALSALARLHEKAGDWEKCVAVLQRAAALPADPADAAEVQYRLGMLEWKERQRLEARDGAHDGRAREVADARAGARGAQGAVSRGP